MRRNDFEEIREALRRASAAVRFTEAGHTYRANLTGETVVSVTQVLRRFFPDDFAQVPKDVLERKRQIGSAAHQATHLWDRGILDATTVAPEVLGYLAAWSRFVDENQPTIIATELRLMHPQRALAGTLDKLAWMPGKPLNAFTIIDLKTGDPDAARAHLQTAAYAELVRAVLQPAPLAEPAFIERMSVQLRPDGTYRSRPYSNRLDWRRFSTLFDALTIVTEETRHVAA